MGIGDRMVEGNRGNQNSGDAPSLQRDSSNPSEREWERGHPTGRVDRISTRRQEISGGRRIILWNFAVSGITLRTEHRTALDGLAGDALAAMDRGIRVLIIGRASDSGTFGNNYDLSRGRAEAALAYLKDVILRQNPDKYATGRLTDVANRRRLDRMLVARYLGNRRPLRPNITAELMAYNRSVEIIIDKNIAPNRCDFALNELSFPSEILNLLRPRIEANRNRVRNGNPVVEIVPNTLTGVMGHTNFILKMCCDSSRPLGVILLLPEDVSYYQRLKDESGIQGPSARVWSQVARSTNRRLFNLSIANPCASLSRIRQQYRSETDAAMRQLLLGLIEVFGPSGRGGQAGSIVALLEKLVGLTADDD